MGRRNNVPPLPEAPQALVGDIRALIEAARERATSAVNGELTMLYWRVGRRIHTQILEGRRAEYGEEVLPRLSAQLVKDYGSSFSVKNLRRMVQFAVTFPDEQIVVSLIRQLSWTHFIALIPLKDPCQRDYYAQMPVPNGGVSEPCASASSRFVTKRFSTSGPARELNPQGCQVVGIMRPQWHAPQP